MLEYIHKSNMGSVINWGFLIGEMSNLTLFPVYHYMKTFNLKNYKIGTYDNLYNKLKQWRHIQAVWYILLRYFVFGYFAFIFPFKVGDILLLGNLYMIYLMGIYWGVGLLKGLYVDYYVS
tara:strand:- start:1126 stop:1485 length:360 start_codon:yes stop_codon:yes gene_type:complete